MVHSPTQLLSAILNDYSTCLSLEVALPTYLALHTQRVQTAKEAALLLPLRSDKDKDAGKVQVANDTTKKLRTTQTKQPSEQEIQAKTQLAALQAQCDALSKAMITACKPRDAVPLKHRSNLTTQGVHLLLHSSWNWQSIPSGSRSRDFHSIAGAAVLEFNIIAEYRDELVQSTPAASYLHSLFAAQFQEYVKKPTVFFSRRNASAAAPPQFSFPDQISHPSNVTDETFAISDALSSWVSYRDKQGDQGIIQKVVSAVEKCTLAWQDPFNLAKSKSPELNKGVQRVLCTLVKVSIQDNSSFKHLLTPTILGTRKECLPQTHR